MSKSLVKMTRTQIVEALCQHDWVETRRYVEGDFNREGQPAIVYILRVLSRGGIEIQNSLPVRVDLVERTVERADLMSLIDEPRTCGWHVYDILHIVGDGGSPLLMFEQDDLLAMAIDECLAKHPEQSKHLFEFDREEIFHAKWERPPAVVLISAPEDWCSGLAA